MSQHTCYYFEDPDCSSGQRFEYSSIFPFAEYSAEYVEVEFDTNLTVDDEIIRVYYQRATDTSRRQYPDLSYGESFPLTPEEKPLIVRADNFEIRFINQRETSVTCHPYCQDPLGKISNLVTVVQANVKPQGSTKLILRAVEPEGSGTTFTYSTANVSGFAVANDGLVTPPTAEVGYINRKTYSAGYSGGYYPTPITSSISRSVDVQVTAPNYYLNAGSIVSGTEFAVQQPTGTPNTGSWSTVQNSNYAHSSGQILTGDKNSALLFGGSGTVSPNPTNKTEEWNGTSWSTGGDLYVTEIKFFGAVGTQTDTLTAGGDIGTSGTITTANNYVYNGTSWSQGGSLNQPRRNVNMGGTTSDALIVGGRPFAVGTSTELFDGISWSVGGNYFDQIDSNAVFGDSTNAIISAGGILYDAPEGDTNKAASYDGISWSRVQDMPLVNYNAATMGSQTNGLLVGGRFRTSGGSSTAISWNGYAWSTANSVPNPDNGLRPGGAGSTTSAMFSIASDFPLNINYNYELT